MADFEYEDIDFGYENDDDDHVRSFIQVIPGDIQVARRRFAFPGVNAEYAQFLGTRSRMTTWLIDMVADAYSYLTAFEMAMENLKLSGRTYQLTERAIQYSEVYIEAFERNGPLVALQSPWMWAQRYVVHYRILP